MHQQQAPRRAALTILLVLVSGLGACGRQGMGPTPSSPSPELVPAPSSTPTGVHSTRQAPSGAAAASASPVPTVRATTPVPSRVAPAASPGQAANPIVAENQQPGATDWMPDPGFDTHNETAPIVGFADAASVNVGGAIGLAISARTAGTYTLSIYRVGWYAGAGARLMKRVTGLAAPTQGYWESSANRMVGCPSCEIDAQTGLLDTHWQPAYTLDVPGDWVSGIYLAKMTLDQGGEGYLTFVVRDDGRQSDLLVQMPVNTYQAYNTWGGKSLYPFDSAPPPTIGGNNRAVKVSFNRPITRMSPLLITRDVIAARFLEQRGYDVTYTTSVDLDADPAALQRHRAFISVGHDEYWTKGMRDGLEAARDAGLSLAFWGGNDVYWQARYESDREGRPRRLLVVYKDAALDPMSAANPAQTTVRWISPPVNRPQNSLTGMLYGGQTMGAAAAWLVAPTAPQQLLAGTGLKPGDRLPGLVAPECDKAVNDRYTPPNLAIISRSPMTALNGLTIICNSTWYQAASGALVFNAGAIDWPLGLDGFGTSAPNTFADPRLMKLAENLLAAFGAQPAIQVTP